MKDYIGQLYTGFLLRDLLGYVVPGAFVLGCMFNLLSAITGTPSSDMLDVVLNSASSQFFLICLCYICGHFLSGVFFHCPLFKRVFSYSPNSLPSDYPETPPNQAWSTHRAQYRKACEMVGLSMRSHVERHGALVHFTGHVSASFLFVAIYICAFAIYSSNIRFLLYLIPILIVFPGIFLHFRCLLAERYYLERATIEAATVVDNGTTENNLNQEKE